MTHFGPFPIAPREIPGLIAEALKPLPHPDDMPPTRNDTPNAAYRAIYELLVDTYLEAAAVGTDPYEWIGITLDEVAQMSTVMGKWIRYRQEQP